MRRIRTSTWILTAIFLVAFVAYLFVKPTPAVTVRHAPARREHSGTPAPTPRTPLPGVATRPCEQSMKPLRFPPKPASGGRSRR